MAPTEALTEIGQHAGKYLIFLLGKEEFGVSVLNIREIIPLQDIAPVPQAPAYIRGVINLRASAIGVLDLRQKFGLPHIEDTEHTCIIVADVNKGGRSLRIGMVVDGVAEVLNIAAAEIEPPPSGRVTASSYLLGIARNRDKIRLLLDVEQVIAGGEWDTGDNE
jgi:purine-binding chemotaxis protein CheW